MSINNNMKSCLSIQVTLAIFFYSITSIAQAKDVSAQQAGVEFARKEVEKADVVHKANLKEVGEAEKLLEQRKKAFEEQTKILAEDRKKAELSKQSLQDANNKLNKAQAILDQAWKE